MSEINEISNLISQCLQKKRKAQTEIYNLFYKRMYNTSLRIIKSADDACDVMQNAFISAFDKMEQFSGKTPFEAWLRRIVINKSLDFLREKKKMNFVNDLEFVDLEEETNEDEIDFSNIRIEIVKEELEKMDAKNQLILNLHLIEDLDYEEIAKMLKLSNGTVRVRYMRAKKLLLGRIKNNRTIQNI